MKKFEEAKLEVMLVKNSVITTSGCDGRYQGDCTGSFASAYDPQIDNPVPR